MGKNITLVCVMLVLTLCVSGQTIKIHDPALSKVIKAKAALFSSFLVKKDYKSYVKGIYPRIIDMVGGYDAMMSTLAGADQLMKEEKTELVSIGCEEPFSMVYTEDALQCVIPLTKVYKRGEANVSEKGILIGFSDDKGETWTFMEASGKDPDSVRKVFPEVDPLLEFPAGEPVSEIKVLKE